MISPLRYSGQLLQYLSKENSRGIIIVFVKSLYVFLVLKIIFLAPVLQDIMEYLPIHLISVRSRILYAPITLAQTNLYIFFFAFLSLLIIGLIVRLNYYTAVLIFWLSFCLSRLTGTVVNGSDQILNLYLFFAVFLSRRQTPEGHSLKSLEGVTATLTLLLCRIQLTLIYLLSGFDKITSGSWRSGEAVYSIMNLEFYFNPYMRIHLDGWIYPGLGWLIIIFELCFPFLIWARRVQILLVGVGFHFCIAVLLSLPDFGLIMILMLILFLPAQSVSKLISFGDHPMIKESALNRPTASDDN